MRSNRAPGPKRSRREGFPHRRRGSLVCGSVSRSSLPFQCACNRSNRPCAQEQTRRPP